MGGAPYFQNTELPLSPLPYLGLTVSNWSSKVVLAIPLLSAFPCYVIAVGPVLSLGCSC